MFHYPSFVVFLASPGFKVLQCVAGKRNATELLQAVSICCRQLPLRIFKNFCPDRPPSKPTD